MMHRYDGGFIREKRLGEGIGNLSAEMDREEGVLYFRIFSDEEDDPNDYRTLLSLEKTIPDDNEGDFSFTFTLSEHPETGEKQKYTAILAKPRFRYSALYIYPQYGKNVIYTGRITVTTKQD